MIERATLFAALAAISLGGCNDAAPPPADTSLAKVGTSAPAAPDQRAARKQIPKAATADAGRYTSIDPKDCRLIEQNTEEGPYSRHLCGGLAGYQLEISESDLRQDVVVIAPDRRRAELQLSSLVAKGAFNSLGTVAEWRGGEVPQALIVRLNVAAGPEPVKPDISNLVVARLAKPACVVAVVAPGPGQNATARRIADGPLPKYVKG